MHYYYRNWGTQPISNTISAKIENVNLAWIAFIVWEYVACTINGVSIKRLPANVKRNGGEQSERKCKLKWFGNIKNKPIQATLLHLLMLFNISFGCHISMMITVYLFILIHHSRVYLTNFERWLDKISQMIQVMSCSILISGLRIIIINQDFFFW